MSESSSWREVLGELITDLPAERMRIATEIGVRAITLTRWVQGTSAPRSQNLRQLIQALPPPYRARALKLVGQSEPELTSVLTQESAVAIDYTFTMEVLKTRASSPEMLLFWSITHLVLQHALRRIDPERLGLAINVVKCMPPRDNGKVRSLRESAGQGTFPWSSDLEDQATLLGAESLAGHVVARGHLGTVQDLATDHSFIPAYQGKHEVSAVASPIMYCNRTAGCMLFSSTQPNYFLSPSRLSLIEGYTQLAALAFRPEEFYPLDSIQLALMPSPQLQRQFLATFRQRVMRLMLDSSRVQTPLKSNQAEELAWQEIETELINASYQRRPSETTRR